MPLPLSGPWPSLGFRRVRGGPLLSAMKTDRAPGLFLVQLSWRGQRQPELRPGEVAAAPGQYQGPQAALSGP